MSTLVIFWGQPKNRIIWFAQTRVLRAEICHRVLVNPSPRALVWKHSLNVFPSVPGSRFWFQMHAVFTPKEGLQSWLHHWTSRSATERQTYFSFLQWSRTTASQKRMAFLFVDLDKKDMANKKLEYCRNKTCTTEGAHHRRSTEWLRWRNMEGRRIDNALSARTRAK